MAILLKCYETNGKDICAKQICLLNFIQEFIKIISIERSPWTVFHGDDELGPA